MSVQWITLTFTFYQIKNSLGKLGVTKAISQSPFRNPKLTNNKGFISLIQSVVRKISEDESLVNIALIDQLMAEFDKAQ